MPQTDAHANPERTAARYGNDAVLAAIVDTYEGLQPEGLGKLADIYAAQVRFRDPFNDVTGLPAVQAIFAHMYRQLAAPHFVVLRAVRGGTDVFLTWDMHFRFRSWQRDRDQIIHGASHLVLDVSSGLVLEHRDYWDAAAELYEKLPCVGSLMRGLKRMGRT